MAEETNGDTPQTDMGDNGLTALQERLDQEDAEQANTNCLEGIRCPKCGSYEPFYIGPVDVTLTVFDDGTEHTGDAEWDDDTDIICRECQHSGIVSEFKLGLESEKPYTVGRTDREGILARFATEREASEYIGTFLDAAEGVYYLDGPEGGSISAEVHSDDHVVEVAFNASPWFTQASAEQIAALARCDWGGDYPADAVATYMTDHIDGIKRMFTHLGLNQGMGFECHVSHVEAMAWLAAIRPEVHELIEREMFSHWPIT